MTLYNVPEGADKRMYFFLFALTLGNTVGYQGWSLLFTNFAVSVAHLDASGNGLVQSLREVPGLLSFLVLPILFVVKEHRLAAYAVIGTGVGTALTGMFPSLIPLMLTSLLMSLGFHFFEVVNQSLILQYFDLRTTPLVMGRLRGLAAGGSLLASIMVLTLSTILSYQTLFWCFGGFCILTGLWALTNDPTDKNLPKQSFEIVLRKKYWLFYLLTLILGARRQIFLVFALFLLVERFGLSVQTIAFIFMCNYAINWFLNPLIGRMINSIGERKILSLEYLASFCIFAGYAFTDSAWVAGALYILDFIFFNFGISLRTFFQKIANVEDIAPGMAVSQTVNHICAVIVPIVGGYVWVTIGYQIPFFVAMGLAMLSLFFVQFLDNELKKYGPHTRTAASSPTAS